MADIVREKRYVLPVISEQMVLKKLHREALTNLLNHLENRGKERRRQFQAPSTKVKKQMLTLSGMILQRRGKLMACQKLLDSPSHFDFQEVHEDRDIYVGRISLPTEYWKRDEVSR